MLDVRRLLVLRVVARHGSMTAAATPLGYTPAAVSAHVAALERQVGTALLERHRRGVRLTDAGALLVEHATAIAERVERAEADLRSLLDVRTGRLRIAAFPTAAASLLPDAVGAFRREHPDVEITMGIRDNASCPALVRDGTYDVGVVFDGYPGQDLELGDLQVRPLLDDELTVALPAGHPRAGQPSVALDELAGEAWIRENGPDPSCRELLDRLATAAGFRPRVAFDGTDYTAVARLVAVGVGVALVPGLVADQVGRGVAEVRLLPLRPRVSRRICVVLPVRPNPAALVFCNQSLLRSSPMTAPTLRPRLSFTRYPDAIADQARRLADALSGADLATPVPSCPDWNLAQLTGHVGEELRWLEGMVRARAGEMADDTAMRELDPHPDRDAATTAEWIVAGADALADAVREAGPGVAMWTPVPGEDVGFLARRFAHEGALHRADAELALGREFTLEPDLALDAVAEWLELSVHPVMVEYHPERAALLGPGRTIAVVTDGAAWTVDLSGDVVALRDGDDGGAAASVRGSTLDVLLVLYRRRDLAALGVEGDRALVEAWLGGNAFA